MINFELCMCKTNKNSIIIFQAIIEMTNTQRFTGDGDRNEGETSIGSRREAAPEDNEDPLFVHE